MAAGNKFHSFVKALAEKKHLLGTDQLKIALCNAASAPVSGNAVLADLTQIAYTNLSAREVTTVSADQAAGVLKLICQDLVLTASGAVAPFRYVVLYNDTATNDELICWYDNGSEVTLASGNTFTVDFDGTNGVATLG